MSNPKDCIGAQHRSLRRQGDLANKNMLFSSRQKAANNFSDRIVTADLNRAPVQHDFYQDDQFLVQLAADKTRVPRNQHTTAQAKIRLQSPATSNHSNYSADTVHQVWFKVNYKSELGEEVYVFGSIPELGGWKTNMYKLIWTEGHVWVSEKPVITKSRHFFYKYRVIVDGELKIWEEGIDRICQPELLPDGTHGYKTDKSFNAGRNVQIEDKWETFTIKFQVFDPLYKPGDQMWIEKSQSPEGEE